MKAKYPVFSIKRKYSLLKPKYQLNQIQYSKVPPSIQERGIQHSNPTTQEKVKYSELQPVFRRNLIHRIHSTKVFNIQIKPQYSDTLILKAKYCL